MSGYKPLIFVLALALASLACGGSRDIIASSENVGQSNQSTNANITSQASEAGPTAIPTQVQAIASAEVFDTINYTSGDYLYFIGQIRNTGNVDLEFVEVHVILRDTNGILVASESSYSELDVIPVGETSPFEVMFFETPQSWQSFETNVEGDEADFLEPYVDFEVISSQGNVPSFGDYYINGEIRNVGLQDAEFVEVIAALYDANDQIIGLAFTYSDFDKVTAGGSSPFEMYFFSKAPGDVTRYEIFVQGNAIE